MSPVNISTFFKDTMSYSHDEDVYPSNMCCVCAVCVLCVRVLWCVCCVCAVKGWRGEQATILLGRSTEKHISCSPMCNFQFCFYFTSVIWWLNTEPEMCVFKLSLGAESRHS